MLVEPLLLVLLLGLAWFALSGLWLPITLALAVVALVCILWLRSLWFARVTLATVLALLTLVLVLLLFLLLAKQLVDLLAVQASEPLIQHPALGHHNPPILTIILR